MLSRDVCSAPPHMHTYIHAYTFPNAMHTLYASRLSYLSGSVPLKPFMVDTRTVVLTAFNLPLKALSESLGSMTIHSYMTKDIFLSYIYIYIHAYIHTGMRVDGIYVSVLVL